MKVHTERAGGWKPHRNINPGVTGVIVKAAQGQLGGWYFTNNATAARYLKLYDQTTTPTESNTPVLTLEILPSLGANLVGPVLCDFVVGITYRVTTGVADNDTGAPTANDVILNLFYR